MRSPRCARRWISCATTPPRRRSEVPPRDAARPDRREQPARAARPRRVRRISPWNFPLAIFTGQIAAALVAGNAVIAKPAPADPADRRPRGRAAAPGGRSRGRADPAARRAGRSARALVASPGIAGVAFTGSTETARAINRALAASDGPIVPLIAETGGQNAMIVDSSALPEQVVADVLLSAFRSRRPALLGAARPVPAGRHRARASSRCWPARCRSCGSAIPACSRPTSAR